MGETLNGSPLVEMRALSTISPKGCAITKLVARLLRHGSTFPEVGASENPGGVQAAAAPEHAEIAGVRVALAFIVMPRRFVEMQKGPIGPPPNAIGICYRLGLVDVATIFAQRLSRARVQEYASGQGLERAYRALVYDRAVLGDRIRGVQAIYDRHAYEKEKSDALAKLGKLIETIVNPPDNVAVLWA